MNKIVQPAGNAKIAVAELQGLKRSIITGAAISTAIVLAGVKSNAFLYSVIGVDGDAAALADSVIDFTATSTITAISKALAGVTLVGTDPVDITVTGHGMTTGDYLTFDDTIVGTTELNSTSWVIDGVDANHVTLRGSNSANFTAWVSGGNITTQRGQLVCTSNTVAYQLMVDTYTQPNV